MQGGRNRIKWDEIAEQLQTEHFQVYGVAETHLRDEEEPPFIAGYTWVGCNRKREERRGGGLGALVKGQDWERVRESCSEHMWLKGTVGNVETILGVVYLKTGNGSKEENAEHFKCMAKDIREVAMKREIIILGDMNAHLEYFDGATDATGQMLVDFCEAHDFVIVNTEIKCDGKITWERNNTHSTIDYCLMSHKLYERLGCMEIDEEGTKSLGSDHKRIKISFGRTVPLVETKERKGMSKLNDRQLQEVAKNIESMVSKQPQREWTYGELIGIFKRELEKGQIRKLGSKQGKYKPKSWWDREVKEAVEQRKDACRKHRAAKKRGATPEEVETKWEEYLAMKREAMALIQAKIAKVGVQWMLEIRKKDRNASKKFWEHIRQQNKKTEVVQHSLTLPDGTKVEGEEAQEYIRLTIEAAFAEPVGNEMENNDNSRTELEEEYRRMTSKEWDRIEHKVPVGTATGPDGIPMKLISILGQKSKLKLRQLIEQIVVGGDVPQDWKSSRMLLVYKGKGSKDNIKSYRPITITSVIYRVAMQMAKERMEEWAEREEILGELQNGFRRNRRLDDNLFVITQCIEIATARQKPLWIAFLDIRGAYDNVNREKLWSQLREYGLERKMIEFLQQVYTDNEVEITWEEETTKPAKIRSGLRQGCPLSPLLFMIYMSQMEKRLEQSTIGTDISYMLEGQKVVQVLAGLMYADDIVLLADTREGLQELMSICGDEGEKLGLQFSREKSGVIVYNAERGEPLEIQSTKIDHVQKYKYLGIWLNEGKKYLEEQEKTLIEKVKRNSAVMKHKALWNYNRYEVVRGVWKGVMVPGLTFGNSVLCMKSEVQACMETRQRSVGRLALGAHGNTPNEGVQGDMGWTSFEGREAISKIKFEQRLSALEEKRWAGKVYKYLYMKSLNTKWTLRTRKLRNRYLQPREGIQSGSSVGKEVKETERKMWEERMLGKPSLSMYRSQKQEIKRELLFDNSRGSSLLFEARTGVLRTKTYRDKFEDVDLRCAACGAEMETTEHIVLRCAALRPTLAEGTEADMERALGFPGERGQIDEKRVAVTKGRLEDWWRKSRDR